MLARLSYIVITGAVSMTIALAICRSVSAADHAADAQRAAAPPCETALHHQFDFWLGDWQVFDSATSALMGFDHIEKHLKGCAIVERLTWLSDAFSRPKLGYRPTGVGISAVQGGAWVMLWTDTYGGTWLGRGSRQPDGSMMFTSTTAESGRYTRGVWLRNPDGTVRNIGYQSVDGKTNWAQSYNWLYRPNR